MSKKIKLSAEILNSNTVEIAKSAKVLGKDIHIHLVNIATYIFATKDVTPATRFLVAMQNNKKVDGGTEKHSIVRDDAIKNWLETFGLCKWGKNKAGEPAFRLNGAMYDALIADKQEAAIHFATAKKTPWNKLTPAKPYTVFDLDKALASLLKRAEDKAQEVGPNGEKNNVDPEKLAKLKAIATELGVAI